MKRNCKTCTLNTTNDTVETCKRMCYLRYSKQRNKRICDLEQEIQKLKQILTEIKPILELYSNSKIGEEQLDGTYKITVKDLKVLDDSYLLYYDPRPAKQALQKINECEVKNERKENRN